MLVETGRVTTACQFCGLTKQSAYALRARDPIFAAGWDAACELARMPLADALYEQALDGLTDTITRDDGRTVTRHRFDSRLSIAVLNRLDRRCDRAADQGSPHLGAVSQWDEFLAAIGSEDQARAEAILAHDDSAKPSQASQLRDESTPDIERVWWDEAKEEWRTDFPAPPGFDGFVSDDEWKFERTLTAEELDLVERNRAAGEQAEREEDENERNAYFATLREEGAGRQGSVIAARHPGLDPGPTFIPTMEVGLTDNQEADPGSSPG